MNDAEVLLDVAVLGEQVDQFLKSDVGRFVLHKANEEAEIAIRELKTIDCNNSERIRDIQNRIWRAESFQSWLMDAVTGGLKARMILEDRDE